MLALYETGEPQAEPGGDGYVILLPHFVDDIPEQTTTHTNNYRYSRDQHFRLDSYTRRTQPPSYRSGNYHSQPTGHPISGRA
jgi:hypothetical protein